MTCNRMRDEVKLLWSGVAAAVTELPAELARLLGQSEQPRLFELLLHGFIDGHDEDDLDNDIGYQLEAFSARWTAEVIAGMWATAVEDKSIVRLCVVVGKLVAMGDGEIDSGLAEWPFFDWTCGF